MNLWTLGMLWSVLVSLNCLVLSHGEIQTNELRLLRKRKLQTIILLKNDNVDEEIYDPSIFKKPIGDSGASTKSGGTATCRVPETREDGNGGYIVEETESTQVKFEYEIETSDPADSADSEYVRDTLPLAVDYATVGALGDLLCGLFDCIISFALGTPSDSIIAVNTSGYCQEKQGDGSCFPYQGGVRVKYASGEGGCTKDQIDDAVNVVLKGKDGNGTGAMGKPEYVQDVNESVDVIGAGKTGGSSDGGGNGTNTGGATDGTGNGTATGGATDGAGNGTETGGATDGAGNGTETGGATDGAGNGTETGGATNGAGNGTGIAGGEVTHVRIVDTGGDDSGAGGVVAGIAGTTEMATDNSLSPAIWVLLALVLLLLLIGFLVWRRYRRSEEIYLDRMDEDMKSCKTNWSGLKSSGDKTYITADPRNLAIQHSKLDVHKCKSALCDVCSPNLGKVNMLKVTPSFGRRVPSSMYCREASLAVKPIEEELRDLHNDEPYENELTTRRVVSFPRTSPNSKVSSIPNEDDEDEDEIEDFDSEAEDADSLKAGIHDTVVQARRSSRLDEGDNPPQEIHDTVIPAKRSSRLDEGDDPPKEILL